MKKSLVRISRLSNKAFWNLDENLLRKVDASLIFRIFARSFQISLDLCMCLYTVQSNHIWPFSDQGTNEFWSYFKGVFTYASDCVLAFQIASCLLVSFFFWSLTWCCPTPPQRFGNRYPSYGAFDLAASFGEIATCGVFASFLNLLSSLLGGFPTISFWLLPFL